MNTMETPLSRRLLKQRKALKMSQQQVAKLIKRDQQTVQAYESGASRPTPPMLSILGTLFEFDFITAFPVPGTSAKELTKKDNVAGRLRRLIELVCAGNQRQFAVATGLTQTAVSCALSGKTALNQARLNLLFAALPTLNQGWLAAGRGEPFANAEVPPLP